VATAEARSSRLTSESKCSKRDDHDTANRKGADHSRRNALKEVEKNLGGAIGSRGDASEALQRLCFHGSDADGRWALWLESSEMGGGTIDGFALQRIPSKATVDRRCRTEETQIDLPIRLGIGLTESEVRGILGTPTAKYGNTLVFHHEHQEKVHNEPFTASNTVCCPRT